MLIDTHVHCYDVGELGLLLDSAQQNMSAVASDDVKVLFFTNSQLDRSWPKLLAMADKSEEVAGWRLSRYQHDIQLLQVQQNHQQLILAPAWQTNSAERLEFLLLGCDQVIDDGMSSASVIETYAHQYALICPWGVGKWLGKRGQLLHQLMASYTGQFMLGDNGGRPMLWPQVSHFSQAKQQNMPVLNGSDPLPIKGEVRRVGSYIIRSDWHGAITLSELIALLKNDASVKCNHGRKQGLLAFIKGRIGLKFRPITVSY